MKKNMNRVPERTGTIGSAEGCAGLGNRGRSMNADYTVTTKRLPKPGETVNGGAMKVLPGGKGANQASAAARLGVNVQLLGAVGEDSNADFLLSKLDEAGVDTADILHVEGPSGTTVITVSAEARTPSSIRRVPMPSKCRLCAITSHDHRRMRGIGTVFGEPDCHRYRRRADRA